MTNIQQWWNSEYDYINRIAIESKNSQSAWFELSRRYLALNESGKTEITQVLADWLDSDESNKRSDALWLIREHKIFAATPYGSNFQSFGARRTEYNQRLRSRSLYEHIGCFVGSIGVWCVDSAANWSQIIFNRRIDRIYCADFPQAAVSLDTGDGDIADRRNALVSIRHL